MHERQLSIAITADPELPVPPKLYGGIERIIDMLVRGLIERGHDVTLFGHEDSNTAGRLIPWPGVESRSKIDTMRNALLLAKETRRNRFDVVHSFSRLAYLTPVLPLPVAKIMSYQRKITRSAVLFASALSRRTLEFTAISRAMMTNVEDVGRWTLVPNGVPLSVYTFQAEISSDAPLVFLGRIEEIKGPHLAIEIAKRSGLPLVIAGNIPEGKRDWFQKWIEPHIDGTQILYVGSVDDEQKSEILGRSRALLMPILWEEPFGIVMAEAMACGTPVLGFRRGSVPEVVEEGVTGFVRDDVGGLVDAVQGISQIKRTDCRCRIEVTYSADVIVEKYLEVYRNHYVTNRNRHWLS